VFEVYNVRNGFPSSPPRSVNYRCLGIIFEDLASGAAGGGWARECLSPSQERARSGEKNRPRGDLTASLVGNNKRLGCGGGGRFTLLVCAARAPTTCCTHTAHYHTKIVY